MADERRFSSAFDALLNANKSQLDALYRGGPGPRSSAPAPAGERQPEPRAARTRAALGGDDWSDAPAAADLTARFGDGWRFEIREQRREGNEAIVLGRLSVPHQNITKTHFGSANVGHGAAASGQSQGVAFSVGGRNVSEEQSFRTAALNALSNCARLI